MNQEYNYIDEKPISQISTLSAGAGAFDALS